MYKWYKNAVLFASFGYFTVTQSNNIIPTIKVIASSQAKAAILAGAIAGTGASAGASTGISVQANAGG